MKFKYISKTLCEKSEKKIKICKLTINQTQNKRTTVKRQCILLENNYFCLTVNINIMHFKILMNIKTFKTY